MKRSFDTAMSPPSTSNYPMTYSAMSPPSTSQAVSAMSPPSTIPQHRASFAGSSRAERPAGAKRRNNSFRPNSSRAGRESTAGTAAGSEPGTPAATPGTSLVGGNGAGMTPGASGPGAGEDEYGPEYAGSDEEGGEGDEGGEEGEWAARAKDEQERKENLSLLLSHFSETQLDRYEHYRRSGLTKGNVRKLVNYTLQQSVSQPVVTMVRGFAKVYVGEIVERARAVQASQDRTGPLTPQDIREAHRIYLLEKDGATGSAAGAGNGKGGRAKFVR